MAIYTAFSFAPVQSFIEKSRKLRDLFGASLILSYLSQQLAEAAEAADGCTVVSPALIQVQKGMPNRILVRGSFDRDLVAKKLLEAWSKVLEACRIWVESNLDFAAEQFTWQPEWDKWQRYTWEVFWGQGATANAAMHDLERRKLKRDWTGINWTGGSSSLTGTDAIAWPGMGRLNPEPGRSLTREESQALDTFYRQLAYVLNAPGQNQAKDTPTEGEIEGKYIASNERLSIPELVKRLVTYGKIAQEIGMEKLEEGFTEISRETGQWTGWFMGDGDKVGDALKRIDNDDALAAFSKAMRGWGEDFYAKFPASQHGRVVYAGGDDFLGIFYQPEPDPKTEIPVTLAKKESQQLAAEALAWLKQFKQQWQEHGQNLTVSVGFVWAANRVPQRDVLQHCREAEQRAKDAGRDRVTMRVVFNSGQFVQWTCLWEQLSLLDRYVDRDGAQNWAHLYKDWAYLKARHAIRFKDIKGSSVDSDLALSILSLYFEGWQQDMPKQRDRINWEEAIGSSDDAAIVKWVDDFIQVGWQLCSST